MSKNYFYDICPCVKLCYFLYHRIPYLPMAGHRLQMMVYNHLFAMLRKINIYWIECGQLSNTYQVLHYMDIAWVKYAVHSYLQTNQLQHLFTDKVVQNIDCSHNKYHY